MMKAANKSFSLIQPLLVKQEFFSSSLYSNNSSGQTEMIGLISTLFLVVYAFGQFFIGTLADKFDLRYFLSFAMVAAGIITILFSLSGYLNYHQLWVYCLLWSFNGLAQACGWPSNLSIMNNWYGKKSRGVIFSAWSSNSNLGNILGAIICGIIFATYPNDHTVWQLCMLVCGLGAILGAIPIFLFLVPKPAYLPIVSSASSASSSSSGEVEIESHKPNTSIRASVRSTSAHSDHEKERTDVQVIEMNSTQHRAKDLELALADVEDEHHRPAPSSWKTKSNQILPYEVFEDEPTVVALPVRIQNKPSEKTETSSLSSSSYIRGLTLGLCTRGVVPYMIIYACVKGVVYIFMYWMPLFLTSSKDIPTSSAAILSALFDVGGFIGGVSSGYITDLIGSRTLVIIFMTSASLVVTWILFHASVVQMWLVAVCLVLIGVSIGGVQVLISASVALDLGDTAAEKKVDGESSGDSPTPNQSSPTATPAEKEEPHQASGLSGTISGLIEGSGSAGAAVLQYLVGQLVTCSDSKKSDSTGIDDEDDGDGNVICNWHPILIVITVSILLSLICLLYIKFSNSLLLIWKRSASPNRMGTTATGAGQ
jgi:sugar phosphate permease